MVNHEAYLQSLRRNCSDFAQLVSEADLRTPIPSCPDWELRDLASHLGHVHRWVRACVAANEGLPRPEPAVPDDRLHSWFVEGADELQQMFRELDPLTEVWTFGPPPRQLSFWSRRQAHETAIHLWDARIALGLSTIMDDELSTDGVSEVVEVLLPRQLRRGILVVPEPGLRLSVNDGPSFTLGEEVAAEISGDASIILLALWRRAPFESLRVTGDENIAREFFSSALTP